MGKKRFKSIKVFEGLYVYLDTKNSPFYYIRVRIPDQNKHIVRSSKTNSLVEAKHLAKDYFVSLSKDSNLTKTEKKLTIKYWCEKYYAYLEKLHPDRHHRSEYNRLLSETTGIVRWFGSLDINEFNNLHILKYFEYRDKESELTNNTKNKYISLYKSLLKFCFNNNAISNIPQIPTLKLVKRDNPRPSFKFTGKNNEYDKLTTFINKCIKEGVVVRYNPITQDLLKAVYLIVHGFIRPIKTELAELKWSDIKMVKEKNVKSVEIRIKDGKTGFRYTSSTQMLYDFFDWRVISKNDKPDDYVLLKEYPNRVFALKIIQRQFNWVLKEMDMLNDEYGQKRTLYSLRHLGIQMRLVNSKGKINIYFLARNCGTSVEMIERFYAKYLPNSTEVIKNLQSF